VPLPGEPALALAKSAATADRNGDGLIGAGDTVAWSFLVTNVGNVTLENVTVNDPTAGAVTCPAAVLAAGAGMTCHANPHVITAVEAASAQLANTATATGTWDGRAITSAASTATVSITTPLTPGTGPVATTGVADLPQLISTGVLALLAGILLLVCAAVRRRPRRE
jgi:hypothetical protein